MVLLLLIQNKKEEARIALHLKCTNTSTSEACVHVMITLHRKQARKAPDTYTPLINARLDAPDNSAGVGPFPLLQRFFSQQDLHTTCPSAGSVHSVFGQSSSTAQLRLKVVTEPSLRIVLTMVQWFSSEPQLTTMLLPSPEEGNAQYWRASGSSSRTQR